MSLTATSSTTHVFDSNATTSVTFTPAANSLVVFYAVGDASDASTDEALTLTSTGHTLTRVQRANHGDGATVEVWYTTVTTSASMTVNVTDNKGSVPKYIKVVWFTDSGGSIPQIGRSDGRMHTYNTDTTNTVSLLASAAGSQIWGFGYADTNFTATTGQTLVDTLDTSFGFAGGDAIGLYSVTATSSGADQLMNVTATSTHAAFHFVAVEITVPGVTQSGLFIRNVCTISDVGNGATSPPQYTLTLITPTNTQVGDVLLIIYCNDFFTLAAMGTPTVTPTATVTAVTNGAADAGSNQAHAKSYTAVVGTSGEQIITVSEPSGDDEERAMIVYVIAGANTSSPVDVAANFATTSNSTPFAAPTVTTTASNDMLICHINTALNIPSFTPPSGMAETYDFEENGFMGTTGAYQQLSSSGATGSKSFTGASGATNPYTALTIAIKAAATNGGSVSAWLGV